LPPITYTTHLCYYAPPYCTGALSYTAICPSIRPSVCRMPLGQKRSSCGYCRTPIRKFHAGSCVRCMVSVVVAAARPSEVAESAATKAFARWRLRRHYPVELSSGMSFRRAILCWRLNQLSNDGGRLVVQLRLKIVEARQLAGANISPVCRLQCHKQSAQTHIKPSTNAPFWNETFFFSFRLPPAELFDQSVTFQVSESHTFVAT